MIKWPRDASLTCLAVCNFVLPPRTAHMSRPALRASAAPALDKVAVYLSEAVFSHGMLYVALSRCRSKENLLIYLKDGGESMFDGATRGAPNVTENRVNDKVKTLNV